MTVGVWWWPMTAWARTVVEPSTAARTVVGWAAVVRVWAMVGTSWWAWTARVRAGVVWWWRVRAVIMLASVLMLMLMLILVVVVEVWARRWRT